jgi:hypothetical protein
MRYVALDNVHGATVHGNTLADTGWQAPKAELHISPNCNDIQCDLPLKVVKPK